MVKAKRKRIFQSPRSRVAGPLRDIVGMTTGADGAPLERLSCGHEQRRKPSIFGKATSPRRRRCGFCGDEAAKAKAERP